MIPDSIVLALLVICIFGIVRELTPFKEGPRS